MKTPFIKNTTEDDIRSAGVTRFGYTDTSQIVFSEEIRNICEGNMCRNYGKTWACPPAVGTFEECKKRILSYSKAFVFASCYELEDSFDYEGMIAGHKRFKDVCDKLYTKLQKPFLLLSNEGCIRCKECTYPYAECRFKDMLFPSLEGYGILVNKLAETVGIPYNYGENTVTYFGLVCYD